LKISSTIVNKKYLLTGILQENIPLLLCKKDIQLKRIPVQRYIVKVYQKVNKYTNKELNIE